MRILKNKPNVQAPDATYPYGKIKDRSAPNVNDGTPVNEDVYGDIHQFIERLMNGSGIAANDLPENDINGFQLVESLMKLSRAGIFFIDETQSANSFWHSIAFGNGIYVAVAQNSVVPVMTSPDGITWTSRSVPSGSTTYWRSVCFGNGIFVAVADGPTGGLKQVMTSPDGITWTLRNAATLDQWRAVIWDGTNFIAVGEEDIGGASRIMYSPDGISWISTGSTMVAGGCIAVASGNGLIVAVGDSDFSLVSNDHGVTWNFHSMPVLGKTFTSIAFGNNLFVATYVQGSDSAQNIVSANDGANWTKCLTGINGRVEITSITFANNLFVAIGTATNLLDSGNYSLVGIVMFSHDAKGWKTGYIKPKNWNCVIYNNGKFLAVAGGASLGGNGVAIAI